MLAEFLEDSRCLSEPLTCGQNGHHLLEPGATGRSHQVQDHLHRPWGHHDDPKVQWTYTRWDPVSRDGSWPHSWLSPSMELPLQGVLQCQRHSLALGQGCE